jgi:carbon-monoxide dehydrogenase large subunit
MDERGDFVILHRYVGARVQRKEDPRLITGEAIYVDDVRLPGMLYLEILRSPHANRESMRSTHPRR